jgi:thiamine-phosphate diphosphorylase
MATDASPRVTRAQRAALLQGIYVVLNEGPALFDVAQAVLHAGVRIVQYRAKAGIAVEPLRWLRAATRRHDALLILNDDWRAARDLECDGVHLGPGDEAFLDPAPIRADVPNLLIALSCGESDEVHRANRQDVDYLGIGSVYATDSKSDAGAPIGVKRLRELSAQAGVPVAAIGGITAARLGEIRECGVAMAAVISAISGAVDPAIAARELVMRWNAGS